MTMRVVLVTGILVVRMGYSYAFEVPAPRLARWGDHERLSSMVPRIRNNEKGHVKRLSPLSFGFSRFRRFYDSKSANLLSLFSTTSAGGGAAASAGVMPSGPPVIQLESLTCSHNGGETYQLRDVSYVLPRGARVALVGRNGAGTIDERSYSIFLEVLVFF